MYFHIIKEENIMKKVLLDICFREEMLKQTGTESAIADLDKNSPLFKKITEKIVG
jgi:hypothetical protein